jgi:hypothetical protein
MKGRSRAQAQNEFLTFATVIGEERARPDLFRRDAGGSYTYNVPETLPREVSVVVRISGRATSPTGREVVEFQALSPDRGILRKDAHPHQFRRGVDAFLQRLTGAGARVLRINPATPLSASIEIGRMLLPKALPACCTRQVSVVCSARQRA